MTLPKDPVKAEQYRKRVSEWMKGRYAGEKNPNFGKPISDEQKRKQREAMSGNKNPNFGKCLSEEQKRKLREIKTGVHPSSATRKLMSDAKRGKTRPESAKQKQRLSQIGDKNPAWRGGISYAPYCEKFNESFKERVRAFFGYKCAECNTPQKERKLSVHHVNFRKDTCCNPKVQRLFVPLCVTCHSKTNHNREYWELHFTELIAIQYGGKCFLSVDEMKNYLG